MSYKLRIQDLTTTYGPVVALREANLEMGEGELLTLLGPSGSGKTTLLMTVAGLIHPDRGEVWIDGRLATYMPSHKRDIGMVFQNYALFPHLTVYENIAFPLGMRRLPEATIAKRVEEILEAVQLPGVGQRLPAELSGGQQQRVALARAMVYRPSIILMDEPLGALDKKLRDQMQLEIKRLHTRLGITILYVTHDQEEAMILSDRICLMNAGEIVQIGTPADLYFRPRNLFVANFLGESNILDATVVKKDGDTFILRGASGVMIRALANVHLDHGDNVKYMVRPENIGILEADHDASNVVSGALQDIIVVGSVTKYYVRLPDGNVLSATRLTNGRGRPVEPGEALRLGWSERSTVLLPDSQRSKG